MADASKLKTKRARGGLGVPPDPDELATSLNAPEIAPAVAAIPQADLSPVNPYGYANSYRGIYPPRWSFCQKNKQDAGICDTCHPCFRPGNPGYRGA